MSTTVWKTFSWPLTTKTEFKRLLKEMEDRRERNRKSPLIENFVLKTQGRSVFKFLDNQGDFTTRASTEARSELSKIETSAWVMQYEQRTRGFTGTLPPKLDINLKYHLTENRSRKSQVWVAEVNGVEVIAKIYQACFGPSPYWREPLHEDGEVTEFFPEEFQAQNEAWSYHKLLALQGSIIPYSYGFFDVRHKLFQSVN